MKKKYLLPTKFLAALLASVLTLSACGTTYKATIDSNSDSSKEASVVTTDDENKNSKKAKAEQEDFSEFTDQMFNDSISENILSVYSVLSDPEKYGITEYNYTLGDFSESAYKEGIESLKEYRDELEDFDYDLLTDDQQLTYDILKTEFDDSISNEEYYWFNDYLSPLYGLPSSMPSYFSQFSMNSKVDVDNYIEMIKLLPQYYEDMMVFENEKTEKGMGLPDYELDEAIDQCQQFISDPDNHFMITTFNDRIDDCDFLSDDEKTNYKNTNSDLIKNSLIPEYQQLISEISSLKGKCTNEGGLCNYENGKEYYAALVREETGSDRSIEDIKKLITKYMKNDITTYTTMYSFNPDLYDNMDTYPNVDTSAPDSILEYLEENISEDFPDGYNNNYTINYVPEALEKYQSPAYYFIPSIDDVNTNNIFINNSEEYADYDWYVTLAHEGFPGHMYQSTYFLNTNPDKIRSLTSYSGYDEGWGLYAEMYSYELAGLSSNQAKFDKAIACSGYEIYALIDIGINYEGWTEDDVSDCLDDYGFDSSYTQEIYRTLIEDPASYMPYVLGYIEIMEMRNTAEDELGDTYDVKKFHKFLMDIGPAQFEIIQDRLDTWIDKQLSYS